MKFLPKCFCIVPFVFQYFTKYSLRFFFNFDFWYSLELKTVKVAFQLVYILFINITGMSLRVTDLAEIDKDYVPGLMCIRDMEREAFEAMEMPFSTPSASGQEVQLHNKIKRITLDNREEYVRLALHYRLHEFDVQVCLFSNTKVKGRLVTLSLT